MTAGALASPHPDTLPLSGSRRPPALPRPLKSTGEARRSYHVELVQAQPVYPLPLAVHRLPERLNEQVLCGERKALSTRCRAHIRPHSKKVTQGNKLGFSVIYFFQEFFWQLENLVNN